jgi:transposase
MLNRTEKEQRVIELYQQGKTIREIAQEVHMSFGNIGSIIRKVTGLQDDDSISKEQDKAPTTLSKESQALKLFLDGKTPIDVAIELDLKADEVNKIYRKFWDLNQLHQLTMLYQKIRNHIPSFLRLHSIIRGNGMGDDEIANVLKYANELRSLKYKVQQLACEVGHL